MNKIVKKIIDSGTIERGDAVIIGFSGGPDSLTLLHALKSARAELELSLYAVHINHKIRLVDCDKEAEHAKTICEDLEVPFKLVVCDCKEYAVRERLSEEEAGRKIRYEAFSDMANELECSGIAREHIKIAVAQNADDQVETVMFHILRGTAVRGLAGIPLRRLDERGYEVIRPILGIGRTEIESYVEEFELWPNMDESNDQPIYSRNKIRLELIPELEREYNPSFRKAVERLSESAACDDDYMMQEVLKLYKQAVIGKHEYDICKATGVHEALKRRIATIMLETEDVHPTYELVNSVVKIMGSDNPSASYDLPGGVTAERRYERLVFLKKEHRNEDHIETKKDDGTDIVPRILNIAEYRELQDKYASIDDSAAQQIIYAAFDLDKVVKVRGINGDIDNGIDAVSLLDLKLRNRRQGDYIAAGNGRKKLQDFMVDEKVPRTSRDGIKLVAIGNEILWILPDKMFKSERYKNKGKYSQNYQIDNSSEHVLFLELR
ncbi:tRNA lysidine(34) synthetase TilS [Mogibacterium pumilum]|uniref:tRNA(Ile)-lysidine synthase n=1 Tax=Mogibacterium pumilum TaxID=86332 RepID=A0A223ARZ2_9FIRM|nr:tRNA lysidine(34) synthetase TilS [Mogibacterium pumilum]ASS37751.1 tRNA lysidine(34) synthetase TilS [Mogibacterium pumilum]